MLQLLRAEAAHALDLLAAHAARGRDRLLMTAVMATQRGRRLMDRERDGAMRTVAHVAAGGTLQIGGEPAAGEEENHLLAATQRVAHPGVPRRGPRHAARLRHTLPRPPIHELHPGPPAG